MRRIVTLKQVATRADVAPITASRVLNNSGYASAEIRERVLRAAKELNYTLNASAQELASQSGRARMLAIVLPHLDNPFFVRVLEGTSGVADRFGYDLLIYCSRGDSINDKRALEALLRRRVEGLIYVLEVISPLEPLYDLLARFPIPFVFVENDVPGVNADSVFVDNHKAGYEATRHLVEQGYQRIAVIGGEPDIKPNRDRLVGYRQAIEEANLQPLEYFVSPQERKRDTGRKIVSSLLASGNPPDAIFAASTLITLGVFQGLKEYSIQMPQQMGLIGYGETEWTSLLVPALSVVSRPAEEVGHQAASLLMERIQGASSGGRKEITLPPSLLLRESSLRKDSTAYGK